MKRFLSIAVISLLTVSMFTGCKTAVQPTATVDPTQVATPEPTVEVAKISTGLGIVTTIGSSKDATEDADGQGQVDSVVANVALDADGKIVSCLIDVAQTKVPFDNKGIVVADLEANIKSKQELGPDYGMTVASGIGKEWNEQANAFAEWTIGKTIAEVKGLDVIERDPSHVAIPNDPELTSSVTITVDGYIAAIEKAVANQVSVVSDSSVLKSGIGISTSIGSSKDATEDADGNVQVDSSVASVILDADGKIVSCLIDVAQTKVPFDNKGVVVADLEAGIKSKQELGTDYGMTVASGIGKEWNEQANAFAEWTIGKTIAEVKGLDVIERDPSHVAVPNDPELTSSVTITVDGYTAAIEKAVANAK